MGSLSPVHWLIVAVVVLLLFGPAKLAGMGKGLGAGMRSFKKGLNEDDAVTRPESSKTAPETPKVVAETPKVAETPQPSADPASAGEPKA